MASNSSSGSRRGSGGAGRSGGGKGSSGGPRGTGGRGRPGGSGRNGNRQSRDSDGRSDGRRGQGSFDGARPEPDVAGPKSWGSLGRRGAGRLARTERDNRDAVGASGRDERPDPGNELISWERVDVRGEAKGAVGRARGPAESDLAPKERRGRSRRKAGAGTAGAEARDELVSALGAQKGSRANDRLRDAAHAFERERFDEARKLLKPIAEQAPGAASVRELLGLTLYRLGRWKEAARELEAFRELTRSTEQNPVLADCYRALKRHGLVEPLWLELKEASPAADLVTEGRIVMAGSLADRGDLREAISLLERSQKNVKRPGVHHLRQTYSLADLLERAGEVGRARELFRWVAQNEPDFADAAERASSLA